jgi:hypothetical protein
VFLQGIVNRLSEANLDPLSAEIVELYDANGKAFVNNAVTDALLTMAGTDTQVCASVWQTWRSPMLAKRLFLLFSCRL